MNIKLNNKEKKYLFTCFHVISDKDIQNQITIDIYFGKKGKETHKKIELDKNMRFMKAYKEEDVTLIEIIDNDVISEKKFLTPDLNYEYGYTRYLKKNFYLAGYPKSYGERCISSGRIIKIDNYQFFHKLDTSEGSSGSPIINDKGDVIGIHTGGNEILRQNKGIFIGKILDNLKASFFPKII
jgi:V8-like Glu-specific endopeptidase